MRNPIVTLILGLVIGLLIAAGAFFGGMNVGQAQAQDQSQQFLAARGGTGTAAAGTGQFGGGGAAGAGGQGGGGQARGSTNGTISTINGKTLTLTVPNQSDITVTLVDTATIVKSVLGSAADIKVGDRVLVQGQRSGNNIAATALQIPGTLGGGLGFPGGGGGRGPRSGVTPTP